MSVSENLPLALAPTGKLRVSINLGNAVLARRDPGAAEPAGVSVDIATELARRLGLEMEFLVFDAARKSVEALENDLADIGFFAIDPAREKDVHFTPPYLIIEGGYLVRADSLIRSNEEVDREGIRVAVGQGSAYDLFLSRHLQAASIVRAPNPAAVIEVFMAQDLEVAAGVKQQLQADARRVPGLRLLDGRFMAIRQAVTTPKSRPLSVQHYLNDFVEELKATGFIADCLCRHGIEGVGIAPAGYGAE